MATEPLTCPPSIPLNSQELSDLHLIISRGEWERNDGAHIEISLQDFTDAFSSENQNTFIRKYGAGDPAKAFRFVKNLFGGKQNDSPLLIESYQFIKLRDETKLREMISSKTDDFFNIQEGVFLTATGNTTGCDPKLGESFFTLLQENYSKAPPNSIQRDFFGLALAKASESLKLKFPAGADPVYQTM